MHYQLTVNKQAEQDIEELMLWYEAQQAGLGNRFLDDLKDSLDKIVEIPKAYAIVYKNVRRIVLSKFPVIIHFLVKDGDVQVFSVLHGRSHPSHWQERV